jgi:hypothetical protein
MLKHSTMAEPQLKRFERSSLIAWKCKSSNGVVDVGYSENWKILEEIIIEFRKKSLPVPENVMSDLKSAKTLIKLMDSDSRGQGEIAPKVEQYLSSVEAYVVTEAQKSFPPERIDEWLRRLSGSSCDVCAGQAKPAATEEEHRFVPGVPRDQKWVRVTPIASLPEAKLEQLAKESGLSTKVEKDGHLIIHGTSEGIRDFVKRMTAQASKEQS